MATNLKKPAKTLAKKPMKSKKQPMAFKNLLAQTFPRYWPQITQSQTTELFELLKKAKSTQPAWFSTKKSTETRPVHYGLQSSLKKIQTGDVKLLVLSADLKPRYIINQIILKAIANNKAITILLVPGLNTRLQSIVDFSCFAFVIADVGWQQLVELRQWCTDIIRSNHPIPDVITTYYKQRKSILDDAKNDAKMDCNTSTAIPFKSTLNAQTVNTSNYHLTKVNAQRAFVPQNAVNLKPVAFKVQTIKHMKSDFISLEGTGGSVDHKPSKTKRKSEKEKKRKVKSDASIIYQSLIIHKVQNSSNVIEKKQAKKKKKNQIVQLN